MDGWQTLLGIGQAARWASVVRRAREIPFSLVTGFLGSGKTSLLSGLLAGAHGRRIGVLVNDFGAVNIDAALIRSRNAEAIELSNGCACCSLSAGLARAVAELVARSPAPDAIVLEASGVAEPSGILHVALSHPAVRLDSVIALADADGLESQLADPEVASLVSRQFGSADLIVLNKADLAGSERMERARAAVTRLNPGARLVDAVHGAVPTEILLEVGSGSPEVAALQSPFQVSPFQSWTLSIDRPLHARALCELAGQLPLGVLRAKGFVRLAEPGYPVNLLQVVGRRWSLEPQLRNSVSGDSELVFIGRASEAEIADLRRRLYACAAAG